MKNNEDISEARARVGRGVRPLESGAINLDFSFIGIYIGLIKLRPSGQTSGPLLYFTCSEIH